jgi:uncharacterized membrane protein YdbT with pleckstrin-like domain
MAGHYLQSLLGEREKIILVTRHHWFVLARSIFVEVLAILVIFAATVTGTVALANTTTASPFEFIVPLVGFLIMLIPIFSGTRDFLLWTHHLYIITNLRVMQINGVFNKNVIDSSLDKVNDIKMSQSAIGRMFGYGDIEILTASELGVNLFKRIDNPIKFKSALINAKAYLEHAGEETPAPEAIPSPENKAEIPAMISKLADLRTQGVLTEAEFQQKKSELLAKL